MVEPAAGAQLGVVVGGIDWGYATDANTVEWAPWDSNPQPTEFKSRLSVVQHYWSLMPCD